MSKHGVRLWVVVSILVLLLIVTSNDQPSSTHAQGGPTSTLVAATPTPAGTAAPTFIPSAPQRTININIGDTISSELRAGRWEIFEFVGEADQRVTIRLRSSEFDTIVELYSPTDYSVPLLTDDDGGRGQNATLYNILLPNSGIYRIFARSYKNEGSGSYLLSVEAGTGTLPPPDTINTLNYNQQIDATLSSENNYHAFEGSANDIITVLLSSADFDTYLEILDSDGQILEDNDDNGRNKNSAISNLTLPTDGTYYIVVASYNLNATGDYQLELLLVNPTIEPDSNTLTFNEPHTARLLPDTTVQWFFEGVQGQRISLTTLPVSPEITLDMIFELTFPSGGREIDDDGGYGRSPALIDYVLPESGTYTINLREYSATIGGLYHILLYDGRRYFSPDAQPAIHLMPDENGRALVIDALDNPAAPYHLYTVSIPAQQWVSVRLVTGNGGAGLPQDFYVQLMDTNFETVAESNTGTLVIQNPSSTSDFLLLLQYRGPGVQTYRMTLDISSQQPPIIDFPIIGVLSTNEPIESTLTAGIRHARIFTATESGTYVFTLLKTDDASALDPYLYVLSDVAEVIAEDDDSAGGFNPQIRLPMETGQQVIVVAASFADASGGPYQLSVTQE